MKLLIRQPVVTATEINKFNRLYAANEVMQLLTEMDELKDYDISFSESEDGIPIFFVGQSTYQFIDDIQ